jgi:hypothetical protein
MENAEMMKEMDEAARVADVALRAMPQSVAVPMARWFRDNYLKAGHKRLGRILVAYAKETANIKPEDFV